MAKSSKNKTYKIGRDARTGQFISVENATRRKTTVVVEKRPKSWTGDTKIVHEYHTVRDASSKALSKISKKRAATIRRLAKR